VASTHVDIEDGIRVFEVKVDASFKNKNKKASQALP